MSKLSNVKTEYLYGIHPVSEALRAGRRRLFGIDIAKDGTSRRLEELRNVAESMGIPVREAPSDRIHSLTDTDRHQGIAAGVGPYPMVGINDIVDHRRLPGAKHFLLLLDNIVDPSNLGALTRTALGVGVDGIIIPKHRSASPSPAVSRASAGAVEHLRICKVANMTQTIISLKKKGIWIFGMDARADNSIYDCDLSASIAIVIGGEDKGIRPLVRKHCDMLMSIPQTGPINSLNASVAGAVVMYEACRQRGLRKGI